MTQYVIIAVQALLILMTQRAALAEELADPTRPVTAREVVATAATTAVAATKPASELRLEAILLSNDRRLAIVNGKLLRVGDWLGNARIDAITAAAVHFSRAGRSQTLQLVEPAIKVRRHAAAYEAKR